MLSRLIDWAYEHGYELTIGEAERTPEMVRLYAERGTGSEQSVHLLRLAIDLNLFKDGKYLADTEAHRPLGEFWESIGGSWGGQFQPKPDGNHYSLEWQGRR
jgi:hypothetical protein